MSGFPGPSARARRPAVGRSRLPRLHVVTDDAVLARHDFERSARRLLESAEGRMALHLRGPRTSGRRLHRLAVTLRDPARAGGAVLLANDRVDVARTAGLDGAQLGARSISVADARMLLGDDALLGASVHDPDGAERAAEEGADFLVVGTIFATPSHPGRAGAGPALLSGVRRRVGVPVVAIGGVSPERVPEVAATGAHGVAVLRGVWDADDPAGAAARYLEAWDARAAHPDTGAVPAVEPGSSGPNEETA